MKTKLLVTAALVICLATLPAQPPVKPPPPKPNVTLVECVIAMVVVGVGVTIVVGIYKMCKRVKFPGTNSAPPTNSLTDWAALAPQAYGDSPNISLQSAASFNVPFTEEFSFNLTENDDGTMTAVAFKNGVPLLTNSAAINVVNGEGQVTLDFSALSSVSNNIPTGKFFRIANQ